MDGNTPSAGKCPVMHVQSSVTSGGTTNRDWWPNQLNLRVLHQNLVAGNHLVLISIMQKNLRSLI